MGLWVENITARGVTLTDLLIKKKARIFAQAFDIQESELVFSNGWLDKFKKRNNIQRYHAHGEAGKVLHHMDSYFRAQNKKVLLLVNNAPSHFDPHTFLDVMAGQDANFDFNNDSNDNDNDVGTGEESTRSQRERSRTSRSMRGDRDTFRLNLTHIELFKEEKNINKEKVNIKEAIDYLTDAWENVTDKTIFNCWVKTRILPSSSENDIANTTQTQQDILNCEIADTDQVIEDLSMESDVPFAGSLADALNDFFNNLEEEIPMEDILDENDIIKLVQEEMDENKDNNSDDSENELELVSLDDTTKSL
ncbi:jerky protein-like isoform X1 [Rhizophagus clarus]|uniref:Jerky protein-like isoform X1 n=1 Tax=Rhizophagus clarus TaxID=94130 RepID=A0A8H3MGP5_9GLOM|nr:jerky protein-like isoform X1 [Rhizophagus clarus]